MHAVCVEMRRNVRKRHERGASSLSSPRYTRRSVPTTPTPDPSPTRAPPILEAIEELESPSSSRSQPPVLKVESVESVCVKVKSDAEKTRKTRFTSRMQLRNKSQD